MLKFRNVFVNGITSYLKHFHVILGYAFSLLAVLLVNNYAFSIINSNVSFVYTKGYGIGVYLLAILGILISSLFYSLFTSILIFVVKRDLFQGVTKTDIVKHITASATKIFILTIVLNIIYFLIYLIFVNTIADIVIPLVYIIGSILIFYTAQSIVIDEEGILFGLQHNTAFLRKHKLTTFIVYLVFIVLIFLVTLLSAYIGGNTGHVVGLVINTLLLVPALEIAKTIIYLTKFDIFDSYLRR